MCVRVRLIEEFFPIRGYFDFFSLFSCGTSEGPIRSYFDFWSHASDLWNYIDYKYVFTVFNSLKAPPERFFEARSSSQDQEADVLPIPQRFTLQGQSMRFLRMFIDR
jgi:hypothetical protein